MRVTWKKVKKQYLSKIEEEQFLHQEAWQLFNQEIRLYLKSWNLPIHIKRDSFNKPYLEDYPDIYFNLSHCSGLVACAIYSNPVGVDIERIRKFPTGVMKKVCSLEEQNWIKKSKCPEEAFFRLWTLKESYIKTIGLGLQFSMKAVNFNVKSNGEIESNQKGYRFKQSVIEDTFVLGSCEEV